MNKLLIKICVFTTVAVVGLAGLTSAYDNLIRRIRIVTEDSLRMYGWFHPSTESDTAALYVLLPMMGHTHESYTQFMKALAGNYQNDSTAGSSIEPHILRLDLRGHGESTSLDGKTVDYRSMSVEEFAKIPSDIATFITVFKDGLPVEQITVIGASIGANAAIMVAEQLPDVSGVVMLSPGEDYRGLIPDSSLRRFEGRVLIVASTGDEYSAKSSENLAKLCKDCQLRFFEGRNHGTDIINDDPAAMEELLRWLAE